MISMKTLSSQESLEKMYSQIKDLLAEARKDTVKTINSTMVRTYWEIGRIIVEHEQKGEARATYGAETLKTVSNKLTIEFGKGFSVQNLERMRHFYLTYSKSSTLSRKSPRQNNSLSWSHYTFLMGLEEKERAFYETEAEENSWSLRELKRQYDSALHERLLLSKDKKAIREDNLSKYHSPQESGDVVKDPYILEFLGLEESVKYSESELEHAIINKLEHFLLELGKGFAFIGRQQRFSFDEEHFFVDLVFFNRLLKCFILIDLKVGKLKHQDIGQMQMYVNYYDRYVKTSEENATIGIILCKTKHDTLVEITLPENSNIYASKYQLYLPTKEELKKQVEEVNY